MSLAFKSNIRMTCKSPPLGVSFFYLRLLGKMDILSNEELPFHEGDGYISKENEPRDWVQPVVEDVRHVVQRSPEERRLRRCKKIWK